MKALVACLLSWALSGLAVRAADPPLLLRKPTVSRTEIAFAYGGDLWIVPPRGRRGAAPHQRRRRRDRPDLLPRRQDDRLHRRVRRQPRRLRRARRRRRADPPHLPPLRRPRRRLHARRQARPLPLGAQQLSPSPPVHRRRSTAACPTEVPLPQAEHGSFSPDGKRIAYVPFANHPDSPDFQRGLKRYRGGTASPIWIADLADSRIEKVPRTDSDDAARCGSATPSTSSPTATARRRCTPTTPDQAGRRRRSTRRHRRDQGGLGRPRRHRLRAARRDLPLRPARASAPRRHPRRRRLPRRAPALGRCVASRSRPRPSPPPARARVFEARGEILTVPAEHGRHPQPDALVRSGRPRPRLVPRRQVDRLLLGRLGRVRAARRGPGRRGRGQEVRPRHARRRSSTRRAGRPTARRSPTPTSA